MSQAFFFHKKLSKAPSEESFYFPASFLSNGACVQTIFPNETYAVCETTQEVKING
jgi:hypothetical protein